MYALVQPKESLHQAVFHKTITDFSLRDVVPTQNTLQNSRF